MGKHLEQVIGNTLKTSGNTRSNSNDFGTQAGGQTFVLKPCLRLNGSAKLGWHTISDDLLAGRLVLRQHTKAAT